ncbi:MAG: glycosyltransferase family 2 protein [Candidatus Bathyarchaeota archaeon]|nr:glycosyltransferase family 2 protein [Candidatus Bathyarchaeota archaeon]
MSSLPERETTVSVIIPTFNSSETLKLAIQSVLLQDYTDFEVWIIGDGCTDDSESIVASFEDYRLHWLNLPYNSGGPSMPRNEGLLRARGKFIAYLGHDDLWFPWHLSELVHCIETSNSDFVSSLGARLGPDGVIGMIACPHWPLALHEIISPSNWLHRKSLIEVIGSWSTKKRWGDDIEFLKRIISTKASLDWRKQLSVLKFNSSKWHLYSLKTDFPQTKYFKAMLQDAKLLRDELLLEIVARISHRGSILQEDESPLYKLIINRALSFYGRYRWPLNKFMHWRWRRRAGLV